MATLHSTKVRACKCKHEFQDKHYGLQQRLHNVTKHTGKSSDKTVIRCTVCGLEEVT